LLSVAALVPVVDELAAPFELDELVSALIGEAMRFSCDWHSAGETGFQFLYPARLVGLILVALPAIVM
jgi:hypothetical protein